MLDGFALHVVEYELGVIARRQIANRSYQANTPLSLEGEKKNEVTFFEIGVEIVVHRFAGSLDIRNVEQTAVGSTRKAYSHLPTNR